MNQASFIMNDKQVLNTETNYRYCCIVINNVDDMLRGRLEIISFLTCKAENMEKKWIISTNTPVSVWYSLIKCIAPIVVSF